MRLSLPEHLVSTFKLLENEGFRIVRNKPGTRRSIKFDDMSRSLYMDVKLPGAAWVRITPQQVMRSSKNRKTERRPDVSEILDIANQELPAAALAPAPSTGQPPVTTPVPASSSVDQDNLDEEDYDMSGDVVAGEEA